MERTICDIVRRHDDMDIAVFNYAVKEYVRRKDKNYARLSRYAATLHLERKIREKMGGYSDDKDIKTVKSLDKQSSKG